MKRGLLSLLVLVAAFITGAQAADVPEAHRVYKDLPNVPCTVQMCSGFYVGGHVEGLGSNADIVGSGINGSIFAQGAGLGVQVGYQVWNGSFFFGGEIGATGYASGNTPFVATVAGNNVDARWSVDYLGKIGYGLGNLFNSGPATPSQGPVNVIQSLNAAMVSPYFLVGGRTRSFGTGLVSGGGLEYTLGGGWNAFAEYLHVDYNKTVAGMGSGSPIIQAGPVLIGTENVVRGGVNRMF